MAINVALISKLTLLIISLILSLDLFDVDRHLGGPPSHLLSMFLEDTLQRESERRQPSSVLVQHPIFYEHLIRKGL